MSRFTQYFDYGIIKIVIFLENNGSKKYNVINYFLYLQHYESLDK
jgi:hypothetical protein